MNNRFAVNVRFRPDEAAALQRIAAEDCRTVTSFVRYAVRRELREREKEQASA